MLILSFQILSIEKNGGIIRRKAENQRTKLMKRWVSNSITWVFANLRQESLVEVLIFNMSVEALASGYTSRGRVGVGFLGLGEGNQAYASTPSLLWIPSQRF